MCCRKNLLHRVTKRPFMFKHHTSYDAQKRAFFLYKNALLYINRGNI